MKTRIMGTRKALTPEEIRTKRALIVGLARSGVAACNVLRDMGVEVRATDAKPASRIGPEAAALAARLRGRSTTL